MPFCPECLAEYVVGAKVCDDCGIALVAAELPPAQTESAVGDIKMLRVRTFRGRTATLEARLAKNLLQAEGIAAILPGENAAELLLGLEVPLLVRQEDVERAARVLRDYFDGPAPAH